jgi:hypothetical protein
MPKREREIETYRAEVIVNFIVGHSILLMYDLQIKISENQVSNTALELLLLKKKKVKDNDNCCSLHEEFREGGGGGLLHLT